MGFLAFLFPRSLGSGVYDEINGGQRKLVRTYLSYISTKFRQIWMSFGARVSKTPCQTHTCTHGFGTVFCLHVHQNSSKLVEIWWRYSSNKCAPISVVLHYFHHKLHSPGT